MIAVQIGETVVRLYDLREIANILRVRYETAWRYVKEQRLPAQLVAGRWWVSESNLSAFLNGECGTPEAAERIRHREARRRGNLRQYADEPEPETYEEEAEAEW